MLGRRDELLSLLVATAPFMSLFRSYAFYNVILATFVGTFCFYLVMAPALCQRTVRKFGLFLGVVFWSVVYYCLSFFNTHDYATNLRLFEFTLAIFFLLLLSRNRLLLGNALVGMTVSAWFVGLAMLPQMEKASDRLGIMQVDGRVLGNPAQLGLPLALSFLALVIDRGYWLKLENKSFLRWLMVIPTSILLALTTSRMSWLIAASGLAVLLLFGKKQRRKIFAVLLFGAVAINLVLISPYQGALKKGWDRTFAEDRSARKRTSGRSDQWVVSSYAFKRSLSTIIHGHGAGKGPEAYAKYSLEIPGTEYAVGKRVALHSLFMQVMVEVGSIGLVCLFGWLLLAFIRAIPLMHRTAMILPLACLVGYVLTVVSVSGNDITSGVLLGLGLLGTGHHSVEEKQ